MTYICFLKNNLLKIFIVFKINEQFAIMLAMAIIQNSYNILKHSAIGIVAGHIIFELNSNVVSVCYSSTSELGNYLCLKSAKFFDPSNLALIFNPIHNLYRSISIATNFFPDFLQLKASSCSFFSLLLENSYNLNNLIKSEESSQIYSVGAQRYLEIYNECCLVNSSERIALIFAEELIFRLVIQKIVLLSIAKLLPNRIKSVLSHSTYRIFVTSLIFAFCHTHRQMVLPQFLVGLIDGVLFEKYGLLTAIIAHSAHNIWAYQYNRNRCDRVITEAFERQNNAVDQFLKTSL